MPAVFNKFDIVFFGPTVIIRAMRYWIFQNNQVNGPFEPDDLAQVPGFSAEALVCPEGRRGTNMGDWQRAGMVAELSVSLLKAAQLSAMPVGAGGGIYGTLPPEPTLKDLAVLGSLQEKTSVLEGVVSQLQDALRSKDSELLALHREVEEKSKREAELAAKLGGLEERLSNVQKLRANLDEAIAAEKAVEANVDEVEKSVKGVETTLKDMESVVERQRSTIEELTRQLEDLKQQRARDSVDIQEIKARPAARVEFPNPPAPVEAFRQPPPPAVVAPLDLGAPPAPVPSPMSLEVMPPPPPPPPPPAEVPKAVFTEPPAPALPEEEKGPTLKPALAAESLLGKASSEPVDLSIPPAKSSKKGPMIAVAALLAMGGAYVFLTGGGSGPSLDEPAVDAPPAMPEPAQATADSQIEEFKQQAVGLVRMWPSGDGVSTVGQRLEAMPPSPALPNPWASEKLAEGLFQVTYYAAAKGGGETSFQFQVRPSEKQVAAMNMAARDLLDPKPQARTPEAPKKKRRVRVRPKAEPAPAAVRPAPLENDPGVLDNPLDAALSDSNEPPAPPRKAPAAEVKAPAQKAADEAALDELLQPAPKAREIPAQAAEPVSEAPPAPKPKRVVPAAVEEKEPSDAELLDELLKP
jgi:hypothetical protein